MNPEVDLYLKQGCMRCDLGGTPECKVHSWPAELVRLREIILSAGFTEDFKWKQPCYTWKGNNVLILSAFKNFASVSFFKGSLMKDKDGILTAPGENSRAARQIRITSLQQVEEWEALIREHLREAIAIEEAGLKVDFEGTRNIDLPSEFTGMMDEDPALRAAFEALTPGRQRGYALYFSGAKKSETRISRIEKYLPKIFKGEGFHDR